MCLSVCLSVCVCMAMPQCAYEGQRTTSRSQFSPSTIFLASIDPRYIWGLSILLGGGDGLKLVCPPQASVLGT